MSIKQIEGYIVYLSQILGKGSYGDVYKGFCELTEQPVAVKIVPREWIDYDEYMRQSLNNEIKIMQIVKSDNIVGFHDILTSSKNYYIVQELCDGDLSQLIRVNQQLPEEYCVQILTQLCEGFLVLVKEGVIHRDLKPANIMKKGNKFKIGDFGFSKQFHEKMINSKSMTKEGSDMMKTAVGTPLYMSVEVLKSEHYSSKCDIWALGVIFYQLLHGYTPWNADRQYKLIQKIETIPLQIKRSDLSNQTLDFLKRALVIHEKDRISWNEIFVHPIFNGRFLSKADENKQYQNKLKAIMTTLRIYFHLNRQKLQTYLNEYGYKGSDEEMSFQSYFQFLKAANPNISEQEARYIFKKSDLDGNGAISLDEVLIMLKNYGVAVEDPRLKSELEYSLTSNINEEMKQQAIMKIQYFFKKLHRMIELTKGKWTLRKVFLDHDRAHKGYLKYAQFRQMLHKVIRKQIKVTDEDAKLAFHIIDENNTFTIDYYQLQRYYLIANGRACQQAESQTC